MKLVFENKGRAVVIQRHDFAGQETHNAYRVTVHAFHPAFVHSRSSTSRTPSGGSACSSSTNCQTGIAAIARYSHPTDNDCSTAATSSRSCRRRSRERSGLSTTASDPTRDISKNCGISERQHSPARIEPLPARYTAQARFLTQVHPCLSSSHRAIWCETESQERHGFSLPRINSELLCREFQSNHCYVAIRMTEASPKTAFLAVLIYGEGNGRRCEEPRIYRTTHPEIAYQLALADGNEQRYGRGFVGLSHLEETDKEIQLIARSQAGEANELVVPKDALAAISDPRWQRVTCDERELAEALRGPPLLFEIEGLDTIRWHECTHAYGSASELPKDIRRLASSDLQVRQKALWELGGSIYHQGTIYPATAAAVPFLIRLASDPRTPDRPEIWELLDVIAESSTVNPEKIREAWEWRRKRIGEKFGRPCDELAADEVAARAAVREAFLENLTAIRQAAANPGLSEVVGPILKYFGQGPSAT